MCYNICIPAASDCLQKSSKGKTMAKRFLSAILALSLVLLLVACGSIMASEKKIMLKKTDVGNTGAVISAELSGMSRKAEITGAKLR